jgi:hypothetical protein
MPMAIFSSVLTFLQQRRVSRLIAAAFEHHDIEN